EKAVVEHQADPEPDAQEQQEGGEPLEADVGANGAAQLLERVADAHLRFVQLHDGSDSGRRGRGCRGHEETPKRSRLIDESLFRLNGARRVELVSERETQAFYASRSSLRVSHSTHSRPTTIISTHDTVKSVKGTRKPVSQRSSTLPRLLCASTSAFMHIG